MEDYQRTTVRLERSLHLAARIKALQTRVTLTEVISRFLEAWVAGEIELPEQEE